MINISGIVKKFGDFTALDEINFEIGDGMVYGLVGINGSGKSTLLRIITDIYTPTKGSVTYDGQSIRDNPSVKGEIAFVADDLYLPNNMNMTALAARYDLLYGRFNYAKMGKLAAEFGLDVKKPFNTFSKGMRRQVTTILALCLETKYIFFDETFDGLDPFKRNYIKSLIREDVRERGTTVIITSHSLKELEDICDRLAVLNSGRLVLESDVASLGIGGIKVQIAFAEEYDRERFADFDVVKFSKSGSVSTLIIRGEAEYLKEKLTAMNPILLETLPLSLEEVFSHELESLGVNPFMFYGDSSSGSEEARK